MLDYARKAVIDQAEYYMEHNKLIPADVSYLRVVCGESAQSLVGPRLSCDPINPSAAVPEPASVAMLGMGLVAAAGSAVRHRRRSITA